MILKSIKSAVTSKVGRQILIGQKHSPVVLFGAGVVGVVGTVVLASRATLKLDDVLKEGEGKIEQTEEARRIKPDVYSEEDRVSDVRKIKTQTAINICKLYAPSFALGVVSIAALTGSHVILTRRNIGLTAAYATIDKAFREYRDRVAAEYGEEKERELRYNLQEREIVEETDEGPKTRVIKDVAPGAGLSGYARCFDRHNEHWQSMPGLNTMWLDSMQNHLNDKLHADGHLFLNEVYDALGFERVPEGQQVGWLKGRVEGKRDGHISFGVMRDSVEGMRFIRGENHGIWLDFNVDGVIWDKI